MKPKYSSAYWSELADDARARADEVASSKARLWMMAIARIYDQLADEAKFEGARKEPLRSTAPLNRDTTKRKPRPTPKR
jgi:hypothetical protein